MQTDFNNRISGWSPGAMSTAEIKNKEDGAGDVQVFPS